MQASASMLSMWPRKFQYATLVHDVPLQALYQSHVKVRKLTYCSLSVCFHQVPYYYRVVDFVYRFSISKNSIVAWKCTSQSHDALTPLSGAVSEKLSNLGNYTNSPVFHISDITHILTPSIFWRFSKPLTIIACAYYIRYQFKEQGTLIYMRL